MRYVLVVIGVLAVIGALVAIKGAQIAKLIGFGKQMEAAGPPPEAVSSAIAEEQEWEELVTAVGSVATARGVSISSDIAGVIRAIRFESGATVKQGQVLVELDSSVERAQLAAAVSRREHAAVTADRARSLAQSGAISRAQLDADEAALRNATTDAEAITAQIAKKTITAPFSGKLGIRGVNLGQYLNPGTPITSLETAETVHVDFSLPQQRLQQVQLGMPARIQLESDAGVVEGKVAAIDPTVDNTTRTARLRADVEEGKGAEQLRPGMFVNVAVVLPGKSKRTTVPATAIVHATYGDSVFIVEGKTARQQFVRTGESRGDFVAILDGVKPKQEVVTAGAFKLRNNAPVAVDNSKKTVDPKLAPVPENR
ncbi:MAG: efflux RND transporter periplasmic adaptor subunit [Labilithrix sp.]|nr:efflux RND transporter periplasmic adaptor subunit [Labilithrix sp.]MCW5810989.1 efflux RND transporter periplasmic adaptor subunit [Labilithrix sp.]